MWRKPWRLMVRAKASRPNVALDNLAEALELHFEPPRPTVLPEGPAPCDGTRADIDTAWRDPPSRVGHATNSNIVDSAKVGAYLALR